MTSRQPETSPSRQAPGGPWPPLSCPGWTLHTLTFYILGGETVLLGA